MHRHFGCDAHTRGRGTVTPCDTAPEDRTLRNLPSSSRAHRNPSPLSPLSRGSDEGSIHAAHGSEKQNLFQFFGIKVRKKVRKSHFIFLLYWHSIILGGVKQNKTKFILLISSFKNNTRNNKTIVLQWFQRYWLIFNILSYHTDWTYIERIFNFFFVTDRNRRMVWH